MKLNSALTNYIFSMIWINEYLLDLCKKWLFGGFSTIFQLFWIFFRVCFLLLFQNFKVVCYFLTKLSWNCQKFLFVSRNFFSSTWAVFFGLRRVATAFFYKNKTFGNVKRPLNIRITSFSNKRLTQLKVCCRANFLVKTILKLSNNFSSMNYAFNFLTTKAFSKEI